MIEVDSWNHRRILFENGVDHADVVVGKAEVGQKRNGTHSQSVTHNEMRCFNSFFGRPNGEPAGGKKSNGFRTGW